MNEIKEETNKLKEEIKSKTSGYIMGGLGVVVGLSWNEAITALIEYLFPFQSNGVLVKFGYAFILTIILVVLAIMLTRLLAKKDPA
jgi:hypothetical protein